MDKCKMPGCDLAGILSFRGRPHYKYCQAHYEELAERVRKIGIEMRRIQKIRHNEAVDNNPARIEQEM